MTFPPTQTFPTRIGPDDRFADLLVAACVTVEHNPMLDGQDQFEKHFRPEALSEARIVPVTLAALVKPFAPSINDVRALELLTERDLEPVSLHAFLALLGQHPLAGREAVGLTLPQAFHLNGYAAVARFMIYDGGKRSLGFLPVRSLKPPKYSVWLGEYELFVAEPVRESQSTATSEEC